MIPYGRYFQKIHGKRSPREKLIHKYYPTPGCRLHYPIIGEQRSKYLFEKYLKLGNKACRLYWIIHKDQYLQLMSNIRKTK